VRGHPAFLGSLASDLALCELPGLALLLCGQFSRCPAPPRGAADYVGRVLVASVTDRGWRCFVRLAAAILPWWPLADHHFEDNAVCSRIGELVTMINAPGREKSLSRMPDSAAEVDWLPAAAAAVGTMRHLARLSHRGPGRKE